MNETTASERERFEAWARAKTTLSLTRHPEEAEEYFRASTDSAWIAWQARAALPAPADQPPSQEPQGSSGSLSESSVEAGSQVAAPASVSGYGALAAMDLLRRIEPHIDAIVCYASTCDEHEPNLIAKDLRTLLHSYPYVPAFAWVSVTERMPPTNSHVWTWDGSTVREDQYWTRHDGVERFLRDEATHRCTTHWMPMFRPQPPNAAAAVVSAQHGASDNSEQDQAKG